MQEQENIEQKTAETDANRNGEAQRKTSHSSWTFINVFGWIFIGFSFLYLFGMLFVVYEGLAFQRHIAILAGEEKARGVLDVVHRQYVERQPSTGEPEFPAGAIAVKLDRLKRASEALKSFTFKDLPAIDDDTEQDIQRQQLQEVISSLATGFRDIEFHLKNKIGDDLKFVSDLSRIQETIKNLDCIKSAKAGRDPVGMVMDECRARTTWTVSIPENGSASNRPVDQGEKGYLAAATIENRLKGIHQDLALLRGRHSHLSNAANDTLLELEERILDLQTTFDPNFVEVSPVDISEPPADVEDGLAMIEATRSDLETSVAEIETIATESFPNIALARKYSEPMGKFEAALAALNDLKFEEITFDNGEENAAGTGAISIFNQQQQLIGNAITELEQDLANNTPVIRIAQVIGDDPAANAKANEIWNALLNFERFEPLVLPRIPFTEARVGVKPHLMATLSPQALTFLLVFVVGAIGSLIYITKYQLEYVIKGNKIYERPERSFTWYLFRPVFGVVVAFAVYLLYKAGQIALGGSGPAALDNGVNVPVLSVLALFAGLLSWHALDAIESRGKIWFAEQSRQDLWATGLGNALELQKRTMQECAYQIGRSIEQVERWMMYQDRVTPEMQDRIQTWLDRPLQELFGENKPSAADEAKPLWGAGLKRAMHSGMDSKGLAEMLGEENVDRVSGWLDQELKVSPPMQWRLVHVLNERHEVLFPPNEQQRPAWAIALRSRLKHEAMNPQGLADVLGVTIDQVYRWMELEKPVSFEWQVKILRALKSQTGDPSEIFDFARPEDRRLAADLQVDLDSAPGKTKKGLAHDLMISEEYVDQWIKRDKTVAQPTQTWIASYVGKDVDEVFPPTP